MKSSFKVATYITEFTCISGWESAVFLDFNNSICAFAISFLGFLFVCFLGALLSFLLVLFLVCRRPWFRRSIFIVVSFLFIIALRLICFFIIFFFLIFFFDLDFFFFFWLGVYLNILKVLCRFFLGFFNFRFFFLLSSGRVSNFGFQVDTWDFPFLSLSFFLGFFSRVATTARAASIDSSTSDSTCCSSAVFEARSVNLLSLCLPWGTLTVLVVKPDVRDFSGALVAVRFSWSLSSSFGIALFGPGLVGVELVVSVNWWILRHCLWCNWLLVTWWLSGFIAGLMCNIDQVDSPLRRCSFWWCPICSVIWRRVLSFQFWIYFGFVNTKAILCS